MGRVPEMMQITEFQTNLLLTLDGPLYWAMPKGGTRQPQGVDSLSETGAFFCWSSPVLLELH